MRFDRWSLSIKGELQNIHILNINANFFLEFFYEFFFQLCSALQNRVMLEVFLLGFSFLVMLQKRVFQGKKYPIKRPR